ncbi:uncharacterized protein C8Q71DRAFT_730852 [Rhodofomes roseus]|uniref:Uncharacterized protein n=1 Tax=Rhodofomes roseus TaxID=34475 RepID=A0ABQ8KXG4_9APHY|nr:uncharacterized protein C8Q71DRAFT_730852 [Rhodofomes roseus]KAH9843992.1 hypothetical protein C8Q71DRAFT_730852 [Rhodofomes roseus]
MAKKGPPYTDDPECKYVVVEDPFPGHRTGKARDQAYWDWLSGWVYYMTGKKADPTSIYFVHTKDEVIVQLPEEYDVTPILGVHVWREVLKWGQERDKDRVSYVFEYNYRNHGRPESHGWEEAWPTGGGPNDPNKFPVKFPYPHPHWATVRGRNCASLALPLPRTRERTPTPPPPEPILFEPYEAPAHLADARNAQLDEELHEPEEQDVKPTIGVPLPGQFFVDKRDPYEEEDAALRLVKQEPSNDPILVKAEPSEVIVKQEHPEPRAEPQPSEAFLAAFNRLERTRAGQESSAKREPSPTGEPQPSQEFLAAFQRLERTRAAQGQVEPGPSRTPIQTQLTPPTDRARSDTLATSTSPERARSGTWTLTPGVRVKPEPQEDALPPTPFQTAQGVSHAPRLAAQNMRVKPEPQEMRLPPPSRPTEPAAVRVKPEPQDHRIPPPASARPPEDVRTQDPRQRSKLPSFKRVKRDEDEGTAKRIKTEHEHRYP